MFFWMSKHSASMDVVTSITAACAIVATIIALFRIYKTLCEHTVIDNDSHTHSSEMVRLGRTMPQEGPVEFSLEELKQATNDFGVSNLIGQVRFGPVYIGLVRNTIVAIKRLSGRHYPRFVDQVTYLSTIRHCNLVSLFGYCCENGKQMIVFEYLSNDCVHSKFKERLSIALGAAKGLEHLHSLSPPLPHLIFNPDTVLLDANFNAKVSDAGMFRLFGRLDHIEVGLEGLERLKDADVYSFGLFLLELITGQEPLTEDLLGWIGRRIYSNTFVDNRMNGTFTGEAMEALMTIMLKCLRFPTEVEDFIRPKMVEVVTELENILAGEEDGDSTRFTLGSELFTITA